MTTQLIEDTLVDVPECARCEVDKEFTRCRNVSFEGKEEDNGYYAFFKCPDCGGWDIKPVGEWVEGEGRIGVALA